MNKVTDIIVSTQLCTWVAAGFMFIAHLIENGTILNPSWYWAIYALLATAIFFMLFPHIICHDNKSYGELMGDDDLYQFHDNPKE